MKYLDLKLEPPEKVENVKCDDVTQDEIDDILTYIIPQMKGICLSAGGYGLSAPQVGLYKKFFILRTDPTSQKFDIVFNPRYFKEGSRIKSNEGCLTYDMGKKYTEVKRYKSIKAMYQYLDENAQLTKKSEKIKDLRAIGFQHETDHCGNGPGALSVTIFTK